jgi:hypothetical protein
MTNTRNEIKAQIIRAGFTMQEVCDRLHDDYGWSDSVSNYSKLIFACLRVYIRLFNFISFFN